MTRRAAVTAVAAVVLAGCGNDAASRGRTSVDSAGVTIITSTVPVWGDSAAWHIDAVPLLTIGDPSQPDAPLLIDVSGVRLLDDGRVAVVNNDQKAVLYFDATGRRAGRTGRQGTAAGEFLQVMLVASRADSLLLWDSELDRATVFTPAGVTARTFVLTGSDSMSRYGFAPAGQFENGDLLVAARVGATLREQSGVRREPIPLRRASATGSIGELVATVPGSEQLVVSTARYVSSIARPFGPRTVIGVAGKRVMVSTGEHDEVRVIEGADAGDTRWRIDRPPRSPDSADVRTMTAQQEAQAAQLPDEFATAMRRAVAAAGFPAVLPPYDQLVVDATGVTWLRADVGAVRRGAGRQQWTLFDPRGRWLGTIATPAGLTVHQITRDHVVGVWTDADGVEQVHVYALQR